MSARHRRGERVSIRYVRRAMGPLGALLVLSACALACAHEPPPDPRAADRARLFALAEAPLAPDFAPEARLVLSQALLAAEVQRTLDDASTTVEALRFTVPFLGELALRPTVQVRGVRAEPESACASCVALFIELAGVVAPVTGGGVLPGVRFEGTARGVFALEAVAVGTVTEIRARGASGTDAAGRPGWSANVALVDLPPGVSQPVSDTVSSFVQRLMESEARPDLLLASMPADGPVRLRGARPSARDGAVVVDVAFFAIDAGVVPEGLPPVSRGFALQLPEQTLLALVRAETLRMAPRDGYVIDPSRVSVDDDLFALELAVFKLDRDVVRRDVRVEGTLALAGTTLSITPTNAKQLARQGGFDPFDIIAEAATLSKVSSALALALPVAASAPVGGRTRSARLVHLTDHGAVLQLDGVVDEGPARR